MVGGGHSVKIPDYKIYKISDCPELEKIQDDLALKGLKDPWLRNEAWRFNRKNFPSDYTNLRKFFFCGFPLGLAAALVSIAIEKYVFEKNEEEYSSSHHK